MITLRIITSILSIAAINSSAFAAPKSTVRTVEPRQAVDSIVYPIPGRTEALEVATLFTRATGIIEKRNVDIGDQVKADDVIATVSAPEIDRAVDSAEAAVEQASAKAHLAEIVLKRVERLVSTSAVSALEVDERASEAKASAAALRLAEANLAGMREQQKFATVRAPFDGVIVARNFERGDRVRGDAATGDGWLYRLARLEKVRFVVAAPPDLALQLRPDAHAAVRFTEFPGRVFDAKFSKSSGAFEPSSGTMRIELLIDNADGTLPAGLTGMATFEMTPRPDRFLLPTNVLRIQRGEASVLTVADGKVTNVPVVVGRNLGDSVELSSNGLTKQSIVIVNPNALLRPGDPVQVTAPPKVE